MYTTSDFKRGLKILFHGDPYEIIEFRHHKPGKGASVARTKMKNLINGLSIDPTFRSGDNFKKPDLEEKDVQFLYKKKGIYYFMDPKTYEQFEVDKSIFKNASNFMVENMILSLLFFHEKAVSVKMPNHMVLNIIECDPAVRGDTVSGASKPAKMSTGYFCQVPLFINKGEKIRLDTRTGDYIGRG